MEDDEHEEDFRENDEEISKNVVLVVEDQLFPCERRILVQHSPYFEAMFNSGMMESTAEVVELKGVCPEAMALIILYLKTGQLNCPLDGISSLLEAAAMFQFTDIQNRCTATLRVNLSVVNCLGIMFLMSKFNIHDVHRQAKQMALWFAEAVLQETDFMRLDADQVVEYLSHDGLKVSSEDVVMDWVLKWIQHDESERCQHYENLFSAVRFATLDLNSLKRFVHDSFVRRYPKMKRLLHEIWKIKFMKYVEAKNSPLSVSPLSCNSPAEEELGDQACAILSNPVLPDFYCPKVPNVGPLQIEQKLNVEVVIARRLLSAGPRVIPMVPALVLCNSKDTSEAPILICYDAEKRKPSKIGKLSKAFHSCGNVSGVANGFKACAVGNCVFVVGGEFALGHGNWNKSVWKYNTFVKSWSFVTNLINPRRHHELCIMDDWIYLVGGIGRFRVAQDTVQRVNISSGNIIDLTPMPIPVTSAAVTVHQGRLYIFESLVYRYNAIHNSWSCLKSVSLPHLGYHSALSHANGIYLLGRCRTQLSLYYPESLSEPFSKATFTAIGNFQFPTENACLVGNRIYSFSSNELLTIEVYDIETNIFTIEYTNDDGSFLGPKYQYGCFPLPRY